MNILVMNLITISATRALTKPTLVFFLPCLWIKLQQWAAAFGNCLSNLFCHGICCVQCCVRPPEGEEIDGHYGSLILWNLYPFSSSGVDDEGKDDRTAVTTVVPVNVHEAEIEGHQAEFDQIVDLNRIYLDLVISYGFLVLFGCIIPGISLLLLLELGYTYRCHAWRLIKYYRRPTAEENNSSFQLWYHLLGVMTTASIMTNAGLICFTIGIFESWTISSKLWLFWGIQLFMIIFRYGLAVLIKDEPREVAIQLQRSQYIASKVIEKVADDNFDPAVLL